MLDQPIKDSATANWLGSRMVSQNYFNENNKGTNRLAQFGYLLICSVARSITVFKNTHTQHGRILSKHCGKAFDCTF